MIKTLVQWEGLNGRPVSKTFYFNLTKYEIAGEMKLEEIHARFQKFQDEVIDGPERPMTQPEIREMLDMIKQIVRFAYGEYRETPDGGELWKDRQDPDVWNRFVASGGFDAFIWYLFEDSKRANNFMVNIWPKEYRDGAAFQALQKENEVRDTMGLTADVPDIGDLPDDVPDISSLDDATDEPKPWYEMSKAELLNLDNDAFEALVERSKNGNNIPAQLTAIAMQRASSSN